MKPPEKTLDASLPPVKSAMRVMEILEFFAERRRGATVTEISAVLDYPQSSTSMLLYSLVTMGYLMHDEARREFRPTWRVMLLGLWLHDSLSESGNLVRVMKVLSLRAKAAVMIGLRQGATIRFIFSLPSGRAGTPRYPTGVVRPICLSAAGKALLTCESDDEVVRIAKRANQLSAPNDQVVVDGLLAEIRHCRARGWAQSLNYPRPELGNLAMLLPPIAGQPPMAVTLGTNASTLIDRHDAFLAMLCEAVESLRSE